MVLLKMLGDPGILRGKGLPADPAIPGVEIPPHLPPFRLLPVIQQLCMFQDKMKRQQLMGVSLEIALVADWEGQGIVIGVVPDMRPVELSVVEPLRAHCAVDPHGKFSGPSANPTLGFCIFYFAYTTKEVEGMRLLPDLFRLIGAGRGEHVRSGLR
jgi:hypothetical protein